MHAGSATSVITAMYAFALPFDSIAQIPGIGALTRYLAMAVSLSVLVESAYCSRWRLMKLTPSLGLVVLFWLWALASTVWSLAPDQTLKGIITLAQLILLYVLVSLRPWTERSIRGVALSAAWGGIIAALAALVLFRTGHTFLASGRATLTASGGATVDPNHFGASLIMPVTVCVQEAILGRRPVAMGVCAILIGFAMVFTGSRGVAAGALCGMVALCIMERIRIRSIIVLAVSLTVVVAISSRLLPTAITSRFLVENVVASQGAGRLGIWQVCIAAFWKRPIAGWGYGTVSAITAGWVPDVSTEGVPAGVVAHNVFFQLASEVGVVGLGSAVGFGLVNIRRAKKNARQVAVFRAIAASLIGLYVTGATLGILNYKYFWLVQMLASVKLLGPYPSECRLMRDIHY